MKRKLIIVSNAGPDKDLQGIRQDLNNYQSFFERPEGGLWNFDEGGDAICCSTNDVSAKALIDYIKSFQNIVDTWIVVFVGHGCSDTYRNDYLEICPSRNGVVSVCSVKDIKQAIGDNARGYLITDCCRGVESACEDQHRIYESMFSSCILEGPNYKRRCKELYNKAFEKVPKGAFFVAQACSYGESAGGNFKGGYYSYQLLEKCKQLISEEKKHYIELDYPGMCFSLSYVHAISYQKVVDYADVLGGCQHPEYSGPRCNQPPFCVVAKSEISQL